MMEIEVNDNTIRLEESGAIKTVIDDEHASVEMGTWPRIIDEFYPFCGNTVQTQVNSLLVQPHTFKRRTFNYRDESYLKREITEKNRATYDIAKDFNTNESTVREYVRKNNIDRPLESKEIMKEMWNEYRSIPEIAKELNAETYEVKIALEQKNIINPYENKAQT